MNERFGDLSEYTTDELFEVARIAMADPLGRALSEVAVATLALRRSLRNAWLDHCNEVAGEVIA